ncbi:MAG TPA: dihydrolipoyl dehydrogenase [Candidatus Riflebacteria bacterium]|jgi:dihydrolipoamide dehydrogenase|nr:dihydrolipoyl dehydrogenase [Candidatus Riflebacteria bacterium]
MQNFDLVILGGGPGGYPLAARMARKGWQVAIVDHASEFGGTCLNWGCIPTKALLASARSYHLLKNAADFGLSCSETSFDWPKILERKSKITLQLRQGIVKMLEKSGVTIFNGHGQLGKDRVIKVSRSDNTETIEIQAKKICLAVGSIPAAPAVFPADRNIFWTSNEALNADKVPESLLVVGGGVIGIELGQVFAEFGSKVCVVEMMPQILPGLDNATAKRLLPVFKKAGLEILVGKKVEALAATNGRATATIDGSTREFDKVLIAVGRRVNMSFLQNSDLELETEKGFIKIDDHYMTSQPDIYAIGDAVKGPMLAHKASYDAMILAAQWQGKKLTADYSLVPSCVYTHPEIAWVGLNEEQLKERQIEYKTGRSMFSANGKALTAGEGDGQIKTLLSTDGKLLGAVIWGPEASNIINEATMMSQFGISNHDFSMMIHPHPTLSEAFMESVENASGEGVHG